MKELKRTVTTEETIGYEAMDGTFFRDMDERRKYEKSAKGVIWGMAKSLLFRDEDADTMFFGCNFEDRYKVWFIEDENQLRVINQYLCSVDYHGKDASLIPVEYIGHRVAVLVNEDCEFTRVLGTYNEILKDFTSRLDKLFADPAPTNNT